MTHLKLMVLTVIFVFTSSVVNAEPLPTRSFVSGSISKILASRANQPMMLVLWSVECSPCIRELPVLADLNRKHSNLNLVLIATNGTSFKHNVEKMLQNHGLENVESWVFAEDNAQRLRYEIDPTWYGDLPRTYFFDKNHQRSSISGTLTSQQIETWLLSVSELATAAKVNTDLKSPL